MSRAPHSSCTLPWLMAMLLALLAGCSKEPSEEQKRADMLLSKAKVLVGRGTYQEAKESLRDAVALDEQLGRTSRVAEELRLLGDICSATAAFDSAIIFYTHASAQYRTLADRASVQDLTLVIASVYRQMGEERKAFGLYMETLRLARVFGDEEGAKKIQWAMLPSCQALDNFEDGRKILGDLLKSYQAENNLGWQARIYDESGRFDLRRRLYGEAVLQFAQAVSLADQSRDTLLAAEIWLHLGMAQEREGKNNDALQSYSAGLKRSERLRAAQQLRIELFSRIGTMYLRNQQLSEAVKFYRAGFSLAVATGNRLAEGYLTLQLGHCELPVARESAVRNYNSAVELFRALGYPPGLAYGYGCLGLAAQRANQPTDALQWYRASMEQTELSSWLRSPDDFLVECERASPSLGSSSISEALVELLLQVGRTDEAFWYDERAKNLALFQTLSELDPRPVDEQLREALVHYHHERAVRIGAERLLTRILSNAPPQKEQLAEVRAVLLQTGKSLPQRADQIARMNRSYGPLVRVGNLSLSEIQKMLPQGAVLVEHIPTQRSLYSLAVTGARASVQVAAVGKERLSALADEYLQLLRMRDQYADSSQAQQRTMDARIQELTTQLYEAYIRPLDGEIGAARILMVVPARTVSTVPLHALRRNPLPGSQYVAERVAVRYLPTAGVLALTSVLQRPVREIVGIGHPGETSWDVEYELRDIRAFFKEARLYFSQQATLALLQRERGDVLHLAVEDRFNDRAPGNSSMLLSDGQTLTGWKQVLLGELLSLPPYPTVILSSLTNDRTFTRPAEVYLMLMNGNGVLITTSFTPTRKAKKLFGEIFYTGLLSGDTGPNAFRRYQQEVIRTVGPSSPHMWAPFFEWGK